MLENSYTYRISRTQLHDFQSFFSIDFVARLSIYIEIKKMLALSLRLDHQFRRIGESCDGTTETNDKDGEFTRPQQTRNGQPLDTIDEKTQIVQQGQHALVHVRLIDRWFRMRPLRLQYSSIL